MVGLGGLTYYVPLMRANKTLYTPTRMTPAARDVVTDSLRTVIEERSAYQILFSLKPFLAIGAANSSSSEGTPSQSSGLYPEPDFSISLVSVKRIP